MQELEGEAQRRRAITWALAMTADTSLAPGNYEAELLERYATGELTLAQALDLLDKQVYRLLYHSRALTPWPEADLTALVAEAQARNAVLHVTGLLCASEDGQFVQVLEGSKADVLPLFARIQRDRRHQQVQVLWTHHTATRWFADWRMAYVGVASEEAYWLLGYLEARQANLRQPRVPLVSPSLVTLLAASH